MTTGRADRSALRLGLIDGALLAGLTIAHDVSGRTPQTYAPSTADETASPIRRPDEAPRA